ncbi:homeobox-leucine zipper protein HAT3 [Senna tora]|uniref:Homeobox-leucine zipper protein HAT3 n=1 Tax=Senna tora TaxID=362788 RepID=A0A835CJ15_9FABA|nr:homeobox-leucine zipper protein HAT3 [Senna tora]
MGEKTDGGSGIIKSWGSSLSLGLGLMNQTSSVKGKESVILKNPSPPIVPNEKSTGNNSVFHLPPDVRRVANRSSKTAPLVRGADVKLAAPPPPPSSPAVNRDDENGVSSPNSTVSSISGKRSERETPTGDENDAERASFSLGSDDEDGGGGGDGVGDGDGSAGGGGETSRKKLRLSKEQSLVLEETFKEHHTLSTVSSSSGISVNSWMPKATKAGIGNTAESEGKAGGSVVSKPKGKVRTKLKKNEMDFEYLKRCCELLTIENRRLQKEVQELRALKLSPQMYMHMNPPTTLTMCPSCERVAVSSTSPSTSLAIGGPSMAAPPNRPAASGHTIHRPVPINAWATKSGHTGPFDSSISRP